MARLRRRDHGARGLQRARQLLTTLVRDEKLDCEFVEWGELYVYRTTQRQVADERNHAVMLERCGIEVQRLRGDEVEAMEPALKPGVVIDAVRRGVTHRCEALCIGAIPPVDFAADLTRNFADMG